MTATVDAPAPEQDLDGLVGHRFTYTHANGFFPRWVEEHGSRTVLFQDEHLEEMAAFRAAGPTYPIHVVPEFAAITLFEHVGPDDEAVIAVAPGELPPGWAQRRG